ncbi:MAG: thioredoxin family protein [Lutibacter sp.]|uniref:thioredoxin family protein n=1 Tax=Lutibacter sp. TaxID=1925666 RepID=UPI00385B67A0
MKIVIALGITLLLIFGFYNFKNEKELTNPNGIQFTERSWKEAIKEAKKQNKLIFLDIYATWCGPCQRMKKTTFNNEKVGAYFNTNFVNIAIDGETLEGQKLIKKYGVRGYPSLLFVNTDESLKAIKTGFHNTDRLLRYGKQSFRAQ